MTRNTFLASAWGALLAAVGIGKAQSNTETDYVGPASVGWAKLTRDQAISPRPMYQPNHCPVCGTKAPDEGSPLPIYGEYEGIGMGIRPVKIGEVIWSSKFKQHVCPTCGNLYTTERPPLRIDGEDE